MKKILILNSSPRIHGNCDILCSEFGRGALENSENQVVRINLKDARMDFYREEQAEDDADQIAREFCESNVVVLATPVYFYSMSGMMKTLIDRMVPYYDQMGGKDFYFILTAAINRSEMEPAADSLYGFTDSLPDSNVIHVIYGSNVSEKGDVINHPAYREAYDFGKKI